MTRQRNNNTTQYKTIQYDNKNNARQDNDKTRLYTTNARQDKTIQHNTIARQDKARQNNTRQYNTTQ